MSERTTWVITAEDETLLKGFVYSTYYPTQGIAQEDLSRVKKEHPNYRHWEILEWNILTTCDYCRGDILDGLDDTKILEFNDTDFIAFLCGEMCEEEFMRRRRKEYSHT